MKENKQRIYAMFQFISFIAVIFLLISFVLSGYNVFISHAHGHEIPFALTKWIEGVGNVLTFEESTSLIYGAAVFLYGSFLLFILSWIIGMRIFHLKKKTLFDSLFLVFMMLPLLANVFAIFAQFVEKEFYYEEVVVDKKQIIEEQTRLIKLEISKERKRINIAAEKKEMQDKARQEKAIKIVEKLNNKNSKSK